MYNLQIVKDSILVQDACNLSGVIHSFGKVVSQLWEYAHEHNHGTVWVNSHPICIMYVNKMAQLAGDSSYLDSNKFSWAYQWAQSNPENLEYIE